MLGSQGQRAMSTQTVDKLQEFLDIVLSGNYTLYAEPKLAAEWTRIFLGFPALVVLSSELLPRDGMLYAESVDESLKFDSFEIQRLAKIHQMERIKCQLKQ